MSLFDDEPVLKQPVHEIGQDLALLSVKELHDRIGLLKSEIARIEAELKQKDSSKAAAEAFFKK